MCMSRRSFAPNPASWRCMRSRKPTALREFACSRTFTPFGGRYVVRGGQVASLEGNATKRIVMIAFPSLQQAQAWYDSSAYKAIRPIRQQSTKSKVFIVEGLSTQAN